MQARRKTEDVLARSRNRAVLPLLAEGLRSGTAEVRAAAIRVSLRRLDIFSHTRLIREFAAFGEAERGVLYEAHRAAPHHAAAALKAAVMEGDALLCANACAISLLCRDFDLFPALLKAAENPRHPHANHITRTILALANLLHDELVSWGVEPGHGSDPSFARHRVLAALEQSMRSYAQHQRPEIIDAFLLLAPIENATFLQVLRNAQHPCHAQLVTSLASSGVQGIMERLIQLLLDTEAPAAALETVARRTDRPFVRLLLHELKHPVPLRVVHNMKRLRSITWLQANCDILLEFDGRAQAVAVDLALASDIGDDAVFELLSVLLRDGMAEGRRASCQGLAKFDRPEANDLIITALQDPDPGVQAAAARQLRLRRLPNALQILVTFLESPSIEVRDAARSSLAEFNFLRYRSMFDLLDEHSVRTTGALVRQVDPSAREKLIEELASPSISTRLRGIEMAVAMGAAESVRDQLIDLSRHENVALRQQAVAALALVTGTDVLAALELAAHDTNRTVADAARHCLSQPPFSDCLVASAASDAGGPA